MCRAWYFSHRTLDFHITPTAKTTPTNPNVTPHHGTVYRHKRGQTTVGVWDRVCLMLDSSKLKHDMTAIPNYSLAQRSTVTDTFARCDRYLCEHHTMFRDCQADATYLLTNRTRTARRRSTLKPKSVDRSTTNCVLNVLMTQRWHSAPVARPTTIGNISGQRRPTTCDDNHEVDHHGPTPNHPTSIPST